MTEPGSPIRSQSRTRTRVLAIYAVLITSNVGAWFWASVSFRNHPLLLGTAFLAYSLGLRHAVDADHIAAIDNVTRKLMQEGQRPVAVGFMFSLGHSTIVILGSLLMASTAFTVQHRLESFRSVGEAVGSLVSTVFLLVIAAINLVVLRSVYCAFVRVRNGEPYVVEDLNLLLSGGGFMSKILRPVFNMIERSWHMYPLGLLFGLGFDTATEIGLLGISASQGSKGLSLWTLLVFPALFTAGMSLIDTTDNILMLGAYGWAFVKPIRKLYYNITITLVSALVALVVGGVEAFGMIGRQFHLRGFFWNSIQTLNNNFGTLGYMIIGIFLACWITSIAIYKWKRLDSVDIKTEAAS